MKTINRIIRYAIPYFILINAAIFISAWAFRDDIRFGFALSVICPILCGVLSWWAEKTKRKQNGKA